MDGLAAGRGVAQGATEAKRNALAVFPANAFQIEAVILGEPTREEAREEAAQLRASVDRLETIAARYTREALSATNERVRRAYQSEANFYTFLAQTERAMLEAFEPFAA